jgi:TRAP-type uncharacterized transport system substrate-binding protein
MSRFFGFVFATCLLAIWTSTTVPAANPDWPKSLSLAVASPGGVSYDYGEALAKILTESLKIDVNPMPTQGPVHMVKLIESGGAQLGFITTGVALQGWNGTGDWTSGQRYRKMRALFPMYDQPFHKLCLRRVRLSKIHSYLPHRCTRASGLVLAFWPWRFSLQLWFLPIARGIEAA